MNCDRPVMHFFGPRRSGLTMVETVVSIAIIGVMMVASLNTVAASKLGQNKTGDRGRGTLLAQELMAEIIIQDYEDADFGPGSFGRAAVEVAPGNRSLYDDVDDYDGWSASPPQNKDGTLIPDLADWTRTVQVRWLNPANLNQSSGTDTRVKGITVTVSFRGTNVAELVAVRTASGALDREP